MAPTTRAKNNVTPIWTEGKHTDGPLNESSKSATFSWWKWASCTWAAVPAVTTRWRYNYIHVAHQSYSENTVVCLSENHFAVGGRMSLPERWRSEGWASGCGRSSWGPTWTGWGSPCCRWWFWRGRWWSPASPGWSCLRRHKDADTSWLTEYCCRVVSVLLPRRYTWRPRDPCERTQLGFGLLEEDGAFVFPDEFFLDPSSGLGQSVWIQIWRE